MRKIILIFFLSFFVFHVSGALSDSIRISLLTVLPWSNEVYSIYGHTAIRVCDPSRNLDLAFNYGTFDSSRPNFIYHFIKGETDYYLDAYNYDLFLYMYQRENTTVIEQVLNLPPEKKEEMVRMLFVNLQPENRGYRYDFLFDNCTTRPRNIIEQFAGGRITYPLQQTPTTFRTLIHEYTKPYPWMTFGIDLLIGSGADSTILLRQEMFLPERLMGGLSGAYVVSDDSISHRPMVLSTQTVLQSINVTKEPVFKITPMIAGIILLVITLILLICKIVFKKRFRIYFSLLFFVAGIAGCLIWFVALVSVHPVTYPNMNMPFFHPFYLIAAFGYIPAKTYRPVTWFHAINFVLLSTLLIAWPLIPQELNNANIPYILCLWASSGVWLKFKR